MIPETKDLRLLFLELNSRRKLIGFVKPEVFTELINNKSITPTFFELYHPVEAHVHMLTKDFFDAAEKKYPGTGIRATMGRDRKMLEQLDANSQGENSPLLRYYNDMQDRGPMWRLYYVYLAGCDYAKPEDPMIYIRSTSIEVAFPYKEEADQQLTMLYDVEVRHIDPNLLPPSIVQTEAPPQAESFRDIPIPASGVMPGQPILTQMLGGKAGDPRYALPVLPEVEGGTDASS